jgi:hypothetical protein
VPLGPGHPKTHACPMCAILKVFTDPKKLFHALVQLKHCSLTRKNLEDELVWRDKSQETSKQDLALLFYFYEFPGELHSHNVFFSTSEELAWHKSLHELLYFFVGQY